jgi:hypothetical protein
MKWDLQKIAIGRPQGDKRSPWGGFFVSSYISPTVSKLTMITLESL